MLTPPAGSLASTVDVLVAASLVFCAPPFAAFVLPVFFVSAGFVGAAVFAASSAGVGFGLAVSAGEVSDAFNKMEWLASKDSGCSLDGAHSFLNPASDISDRRVFVPSVAKAMLMTRMQEGRLQTTDG